MSKELDEFTRLLKDRQKASQKPHIVWATVKEVDWLSKQMTATGLLDGLDYYDVQLGLGSFYRKPIVGTKCLLGVIENQSAATFLIEAEAFEEGVWTSENTQLVVKKEGIALNRNGEELLTILNELIDEINKIKVIYGNTVNIAAVTAIKQRLNNVLTM